MRNILLPLFLGACAPKKGPPPNPAGRETPDTSALIIQKTQELAACVYKLYDTQPKAVMEGRKPFYRQDATLYPQIEASTGPSMKYGVRVQGFDPSPEGKPAEEGTLTLIQCIQNSAESGCVPDYRFTVITYPDGRRRSSYNEPSEGFSAALLPETPDEHTSVFQQRFLADVNRVIGYCEELERQP